MRQRFIVLLFGMVALGARGQVSYTDSLQQYQADYVKKHEVVTGEDKKNMHFYPVNPAFRVAARFEKVKNGEWFTMETSGTQKKVFRVYGRVHFSIHDTAVVLNLYQSQQLMNVEEYRDHLFLPFTDLTSGNETYTAGRYIDLNITDVSGDRVIIDFNKAYNPYCAYVSGRYNCPIPPRENKLAVAIPAGEKNYGAH